MSLTTDLTIGQSHNIGMALASIIVYCGIAYVVKKLSKVSCVRKMMEQPFSIIIYGQYISLMLPLTCPWVFFIKGTFNSLPAKINLLFQYTFFFANLVFATCYIFILVSK